MLVELEKASARALLDANKHHLDYRAQPFAAALDTWLQRQAALLLTAQARGDLEDLLDPVGKIRKAAPTRQVRTAELEELIARFGLVQAADAQNRAMELVTRRSSARLPTLSDFRQLQVAIQDAAGVIWDQTVEAVQREVQRVVQEAEASDRKPTQTDVSRELRRRITDKKGFDGVFTFERASRIARTELAIADNTGIVEGYKATGIEAIEWLAYKFPIWPRRHDQMNGVIVAIGELFTLPSGVRMKHPGDPSAPVGEIVHCRCSTAPKVTKPSATSSPSPSSAPSSAPATSAAPAAAAPLSNPHAPPSIAALMPQALPASYFADKVGPVDYDGGALSSALGKLKPGKVNPAAERTARQQVTSLLAKFGFVSRDVINGKADRDLLEVASKRSMPKALGRYSIATGKITLRQDQADHAQRFLAGDRDWNAVDSFATVVHESLHGHSQVKVFTTTSALALEEVATESASREIMEDLTKKPMLVGAYQRHIDQATKIAQDELGITADEAHRKIREASSAVKRSTSVTGEAELFEDFAAALAGGDPVKKAALAIRLRRELKL